VYSDWRTAVAEGDDRANDGSIHDAIEHIPYKALIYLELFRNGSRYAKRPLDKLDETRIEELPNAHIDGHVDRRGLHSQWQWNPAGLAGCRRSTVGFYVQPFEWFESSTLKLWHRKLF
jgi:hypothetical protein